MSRAKETATRGKKQVLSAVSIEMMKILGQEILTIVLVLAVSIYPVVADTSLAAPRVQDHAEQQTHLSRLDYPVTHLDLPEWQA